MDEYRARFNEAYKNLNKEQKQAVDTIDGPVMVVAGPGTGKTQILTLRIANILQKTDIGPSGILAITFTESGVREMRKRLLSIIGPEAHKVHIDTFHGFCNTLISQYPEYFEDLVGATNAREVDTILVIEQILDELRPVLLRPRGDKYLYVYDILQSISELKREGYRADDFSDLVNSVEKDFLAKPDLYHEKGAHTGKMKGDYKNQLKVIEKNKELAQIYKAYELKMTENRHYDFADMILYVSSALKNNQDFCQIIMERYQYILVDEHQDTNQAQNTIINLLAEIENPNIFVVGDDKQGIYRFQGASVLNFTEFVRKYPKTKVINLVNNYRSVPNILSYAEAILSGEKPLKSQKNAQNTPQISLYQCASQIDESYATGQKIKDLIGLGTSPGEIAVLYRTNKEAVEVAGVFAKLGIDYKIFSDTNVYDHIVVRKVLKIIQALVNYESDAHIMAMLHIKDFGLHPHDIVAIIRKSTDNAKDQKKKNIFSLLYDKKLLDEIHLLQPEKVLDVAVKFKKWVELRDETNARSFIEMLLRESGILHNLISKNVVDDLEALQSFLFDVDEFLSTDKKSTISEFLNYVNLKERHGVRTKNTNTILGTNKVCLMTAHRSKGLEFEHVFVLHVNSGIWANRRSIERLKLLPQVYGLVNENNDDLDERRLFYVAITRAKTSLSLSYAQISNDGKELLPAEYIENIPVKNVEHLQYKTNIVEAFKNIENQGLPPEKIEVNFVNQLFDNQGLSPTALNNYIDCPWKYFYRNLLRLPEPTENHLLYGTSMHAGVEALFKDNARGTNKDALLKGFENSLLKQPLTPADFKELLERGNIALSGWYDSSAPFNYPRKTEQYIKRVAFDEIVHLTGKLDAIEYIDEDTVNVIDYKTGKPKSHNEIMGNTKNSDGGYYRQLVFYKILVDLVDKNFGGRVSMQTATLDFLEPEESGKYKKESFEISNNDVVELKKKIIDVAHEIRNLDFWNKRCDDKECQYCALRNLMVE